MQTIPGTFAAYAGPFASRGIWDPMANIYAGLNYAINRYGSLVAMMKPGGYDTGGMMMPGGVGKNYGSKPERVMSGSQTEWFEAGRAAAGGGSGGGIDYDKLAAAISRELPAAMSRVQLAVGVTDVGRASRTFSIDEARRNGTSGFKL
jgi:hypothetical protein